MTDQNKTVRGVFAPPAKPILRGFVAVGVLFGGPLIVVLVLVDWAVRGIFIP